LYGLGKNDERALNGEIMLSEEGEL
jgi:hypothetical protein